MGISPERAARDQADQVYHVPENMTYREWESKQLSKKITIDPEEMQYYNPVVKDKESSKIVKRKFTSVSVKKLIGTV